MFGVQGTRSGVMGHSAGANRIRRALLRLTQVASGGAYLLVAVALLADWPTWLWAGALVLVVLAKAVLFGRHLRAVRLGPLELGAFFLVQPVLDLSYTVGLVQGLWHLARRDAQGPIT
jgi:hypothetical protein